jgi:hypothetical protein
MPRVLKRVAAELGGPMHNDARAKAAWAKDGKQIKLSLTGAGNFDWRGGGIDTRHHSHSVYRFRSLTAYPEVVRHVVTAQEP